MTTLKVDKKPGLKSSNQLHPVLLTALMYLRDALKQERYEDCDDFIAIAKDYGVHYWDLHRILTDYQEFHFAGEK
jgi:hypothetical protein